MRLDCRQDNQFMSKKLYKESKPETGTESHSISGFSRDLESRYEIQSLRDRLVSNHAMGGAPLADIPVLAPFFQIAQRRPPGHHSCNTLPVPNWRGRYPTQQKIAATAPFSGCWPKYPIAQSYRLAQFDRQHRRLREPTCGSGRESGHLHRDLRKARPTVLQIAAPPLPALHPMQSGESHLPMAHATVPFRTPPQASRCAQVGSRLQSSPCTPAPVPIAEFFQKEAQPLPVVLMSLISPVSERALGWPPCRLALHHSIWGHYGRISACFSLEQAFARRRALSLRSTTATGLMRLVRAPCPDHALLQLPLPDHLGKLQATTQSRGPTAPAPGKRCLSSNPPFLRGRGQYPRVASLGGGR